MVDSSGVVKIEKSDRVGKVNVKDVLGKEKFDVLMNKMAASSVTLTAREI